LANFRTEGHGIMTGIISLIWQIEPLTPPRPYRHCNTCGSTRPFHSSGKVRVNANGRRLDAWLIYKCDSCDRTWNRALLDRMPVTSISKADLDALHSSDPAWVRRREHDLAGLRRYCDRVDTSPDVMVHRQPPTGPIPRPWATIDLMLIALGTTGQRLDRLLARELAVTRPDIQAMLRSGAIDCATGDAVLRKPLCGRLTLRFQATHLTDRQRAALTASLLPD
jgi:hypothetical protein